jgi:diguanylate cyclase (GGDEF)-like protein/PAS domain S-box-containing protein
VQAKPTGAAAAQVQRSSLTELAESSPLAMWVLDSSTAGFLYVNEAACTLYGYTRDQFLSLSIKDLLLEADYAETVDALRSSKAETFVTTHLHSTGREIRVRVFSNPTLYGGHAVHFLAIDDITERSQQRQQLAFLAHYDPLTELPNRTLLEERMQEAFSDADRRGGRVGILCMDLDGFKQANDRLGHAGGDIVLQQVATILRERLRGMDTIARTGGDEFTIVLRELSDRTAIIRVADLLLRCMLTPIESGDSSIEIGASFGGALYPDDGREPEELLKCADSAMYAAKHAGGRRVIMASPDIMMLPAASASIEAEMERMLHEDGFQLFYQPQFHIDGSLVGFEALLRMNSKKLGIISPDQFIPIAEESGLIEPLERWVISKSCKQLALWREHSGTNLRMAVNVSPRQFRRRGFAEDVLRLVHEAGAEPTWLEMEITERIVVRFDELAGPMRTLTTAGITFAVDDFGTGYSSLQHLHKLPLGTLKIDRSFIQRLDEANTSAIVQAMVSMGQSLHMQVIAEGVETQEQFEQVRALGCNSIQGFLLARPLCAADIDLLLARQTS